MRNSKIRVAVSLSLGAWLLMAAQPVKAQDPTKVDPSHYKVELENNDVRVLRIKYGPGEESKMHEHPKGVVVFLTDAKVDFTKSDGQEVPMTATAGQVIWAEADQHKPKNAGEKPMEVIQIELKSDRSSEGGMQEPQYTTSSPMIDATKKVMQAYENQDWETWRTQYADTAKVFHNNWEQAVSPDDFIANEKEFVDEMSSYGFAKDPVFYEQIIDDKGQKWVYFWGIWEGTLAANNQKLRIPVHLALQFKDGKIVEEYGFYDMSPYWKALQENKK